MTRSIEESRRRTGSALQAIRDEVAMLVARGSAPAEIMACVEHNVDLARRCLDEMSGPALGSEVVGPRVHLIS